MGALQELNLCVVTTWPPVMCGLSEYSKWLYESMALVKPSAKIVILAVKPSNDNGKAYVESLPNLHVEYSWSPDSVLYPLHLVKEAVKSGARIVHFQHEYWLYGRGPRQALFLLTLALLKICGRRIVVTLHGLLLPSALATSYKTYHTTMIPPLLTKILAKAFINTLSLLTDVIIVHLKIMKLTLVREYRVNGDKVTVIPHGVLKFPQKAVTWDKPRNLLIFGSIRPDKGIEHVIKAFEELASEHPDVQLVIAGSYNPLISPESRGYLSKLLRIILRSPHRARIRLRLNVPSQEIPNLYRCAHIVILNYLDDSILAASGPLSLALATLKPVIATKIPRFLDYDSYITLVKPGDLEELAESMKILVEDGDLRQKLVEKLYTLRRKHSWDRVALEHVKLYAKLAR